MSTIADDMADLEPLSHSPNSSDVVFHEDEWRQLEFFPGNRSEEIQSKLTELASFEASHRVQSGWTQIFVRQIPAMAVVGQPDPVRGMSQLLNSEIGPAPILFSGSNNLRGRIAHGFTLSLGPGAALYGTSNQGEIQVLGAYLHNAEDRLLTDAFAALHRAHDLILVDWRSQMLLQSVNQDGQIIVWSPNR